MRTFGSSTLAALAGSSVGIAQLIEIELDAPGYLNTSGWDLSWEGNTYLGIHGAGQIDTIEQTPGEVTGLTFALPAIVTDDLATAMLGMPMGRTFRLKTAIFDPVTFQVIDAVLEWEGRIDVPQIVENVSDTAPGGSSLVQISVEHIGIDLMRAGNLLYSNADQQRLYPGDKSFEYVVAQANANIVWPSASYFRR